MAVETVLKGTGKHVWVGDDRPTVIIGERINPTGKKALAAALLRGDLDVIRQEALAQVKAGADVLDVNVGAAGVDEVALLPQALKAVMQTVGVPLCIDTANGGALAAALAMYKELDPDGRPLINSVNGEEASLARVLPLVAEYDAAVIGLCMDDDGIPSTPEGRLRVAGNIVARTERLGIPRENVLIDCLALTIGADSKAGLTTLQAIRLIKSELGVNTALGASNVSFGLPNREILNSAFVSMAIAHGLNCPIVDTAKVRFYVLAADLALGRDNYSMRYIKAFRQK